MASRERAGDGDARVRRSERRDRGVRAEGFDRRVAPVAAGPAGAHRLAVDFEHSVDQVDDPVVRYARARIGRGLPSPGESQPDWTTSTMSAGRVGWTST